MSDERERRPRLPPRWFIRLAWVTHRAAYRVTAGRLGLWSPRRKGWGTLRLTTTGRRTGRKHSVIVGYFADRENLVTLAMNGWADGEPAWWLNLRKHPDATVDLVDGVRTVRARAAKGEERSRLWARWREIGTRLDDHAALRSSETAVVILEPRVRARVTSTDGTSIAYDRQGSGPAVILVGGGLDDGSENAPLAADLAAHFTVYNYARRGRGDSGDTLPDAVDREIEDIAALIAEAGGSAHVYGVSSGGMFALEAAAAGLPIDKLAVYDVPYNTADDAPQRYRQYGEQLKTALAEGRRGDAVELFMRLAGASEDNIAGARDSPHWPGLEVLAHTLAYDAACYGQPPTARLATITQPTLVATGGGDDLFERAADAITASISRAERRTFDGQGHVADPKAVVPVLERFFNG